MTPATQAKMLRLLQSQHLAPNALEKLLEYPWPGNVRELQSSIRFAALHASADVITVDCLPESIRHPLFMAGDANATTPLLRMIRLSLQRGEPELYQRVHNEVDRVLFAEVLSTCQGNQVAAAELLGIARNTLRTKLKSVGLQVEKKVSTESLDGPSTY